MDLSNNYTNTPAPALPPTPVQTTLASATAGRPAEMAPPTDSFKRTTLSRHKVRAKSRCRKNKLSRKRKQMQAAFKRLLPQTPPPVASTPPSPVPSPPATSPPPALPPSSPPPGGNPPVTPPVCDKPPVAANERAVIWGDPHIETADRAKQPGEWYGVCYDIQDAGVFNLLNDKNVNLNAQFSKGPNATTIVTEAGLNLPGSAITFNADGKLMLNGQLVPPGKTVSLPGGGTLTPTATDAMGKPSIKITHPASEFDITMQQDNWSGFNYLNVITHSKSGGVMQDGQAPGGILGETFDADTVAETALKNPLESYKRTSLLNA